MRVQAVVALLFLFAAVVPVAGDCAKEPGNLMAEANCGANTNVVGWTSSQGVDLSRVTDGDNGVMKAVADAQGSLTLMGPCIKARPSAPYQLAAWLRKATGTAYFCGVNAWQYSDELCGEGAEPLGSAALPPGEQWETATGAATTSETTKSIQLRPACSGEPAFAILFDDFVLIQR